MYPSTLFNTYSYGMTGMNGMMMPFGGHSSGYNTGMFAVNMALGIFSQIWSQQSYSNWGGYSSTSTSTSTSTAPSSSYDSEIEKKETQIANAKKDVAKDGTLTKAVETAENNVKLFETYTEANAALTKAFPDGEPKKPEALPNNPTEEQTKAHNEAEAKYKTDLAEYKKLKEAVDKAKKALPDGIDENTTLKSLKPEVTKAEKAVADKNAEIKKLEEELDKLKENAQAELGLSGALNRKDGSWLTRQVDGKNSIKDDMAAFRKASDKFAQNPYSLTSAEIETLEGAKNLAREISNSDNTDGAKAIIKGLNTWQGKDNKKLEKLGNVKNLIDGNINKTIFEEAKSYGCFTVKERKVGNKTETVYVDKYHNQQYILDNEGNPIKVEHSQKGNLFHKAQYQQQ